MASVPCHFCGKLVHTDYEGCYRLTTGWAPKRAQGGANAIRLAEPSDKWAHGRCVELEARGIGVNQGAMDV